MSCGKKWVFSTRNAFMIVCYPLMKRVILYLHIYTFTHVYFSFQSIRLLFGYHCWVQLVWQYQHKAEVSCLVQFSSSNTPAQPVILLLSLKAVRTGMPGHVMLCLAGSWSRERKGFGEEVGEGCAPLMFSHGHEPNSVTSPSETFQGRCKLSETHLFSRQDAKEEPGL